MMSHPYSRSGIRVTTENDIDLLTDVHMYDEHEKHPTILMRTPYGSSNVGLLKFARLLSIFGWAVVFQNVRGRYGSKGVFDPFYNETEDGAATLDWLSNQSWFDGRIVLLGMSYSSYTAASLFRNDIPPGIRIIGFISLASMVSPYYYFYRGGAFHLHWALPWSLLVGTNRRGEIDISRLYDIAKRPLREISNYTQGSLGRWDYWISNRERDDGYWQETDLEPVLADTDIPMLHVGGWYDFGIDATINTYRSLTSTDRSDLHKLIIGPWNHNEIFVVLVQQLENYVTSGSDDLLIRIFLSCLDSWTDKRSDALDSVHPVNLYRTELERSGKWTGFEHLPCDGKAVRFYFKPCSHSPFSGQLTRISSSVEETLEWHHDPERPVPTAGGKCWDSPHGLEAGPVEQSRVENHPDAICFTSDPLDEDVVVLGWPKIQLTVGTNGTCAESYEDYCATLSDVSPIGHAFWVADGVLRVEPQEHGTNQSSKRTRVYHFDLGLTFYRFRAGHRIRVVLAASSYPKYDCPICRSNRLLYTGSESSSCLLLPIYES